MARSAGRLLGVRWFRLTPNGRDAFRARIAWLQQGARIRPEDPADDTTAPARG